MRKIINKHRILGNNELKYYSCADGTLVVTTKHPERLVSVDEVIELLEHHRGKDFELVSNYHSLMATKRGVCADMFVSFTENIKDANYVDFLFSWYEGNEKNGDDSSFRPIRGRKRVSHK